eukprot:6490828-Pyramimonas_sp.AAC.1
MRTLRIAPASWRWGPTTCRTGSSMQTFRGRRLGPTWRGSCRHLLACPAIAPLSSTRAPRAADVADLASSATTDHRRTQADGSDRGW